MGIEPKANHVTTSHIRNRRSTAFYGFSNNPTTTTPTSTSLDSKLDSKFDSKNNDEVFSIVQQIMEDMLNRIEKAAHVLDEAEKRNLDLNKAKEQHRRTSIESENNENINADEEKQKNIQQEKSIIVSSNKKDETQCQFCYKSLSKKSIKRHLRDVHKYEQKS